MKAAVAESLGYTSETGEIDHAKGSFLVQKLLLFAGGQEKVEAFSATLS